MNLFFEFHKKDGKDLLGSITEAIVIIAAALAGLYFSYQLGYHIIGFKKLADIFKECFYNMHAADMMFRRFCIWAFISLISALFAIWLSGACLSKIQNIVIQYTITFIEMVLFVQIALPLISVPFFIAITSFFLCYYCSILFGIIVGYLMDPFLKLLQEICVFFGIPIICNGLSMTPSQCVSLLTYIAFFISIPYIIPFVLYIIKWFLYRITKHDGIYYIFKPAEFLINTETLRYLIYIILFFISVISYNANTQSPDGILPLFKEALLEFVILDTIIYSIVKASKTRGAALRKKRLINIAFLLNMTWNLLFLRLHYIT